MSDTPNPPPELDPFEDDVPTDDILELPFDDDDPTHVTQRKCPGCGGEQVWLEETDQPPASHEQAWRREARYDAGACRGNGTWFWCKAHRDLRARGVLTIIRTEEDSRLEVFFFPDRRRAATPVTVDRRRPLK